MLGVRGLLVVISNTCYYLALSVLPLAEVVAVFFLAPLLITVLSAVLLGERVGPLRWAAGMAGFLGVLLIVRPGGEAFQPAALFVLGSACAYGAMQLLTRRFGGDETGIMLIVSLQLAFLIFSTLVGLTVGDGRFADGHQGVLAPLATFFLREWHWPALGDLWVFAFMGVGSAGGGFLMALAYRAAPAALVAGFEYVGLPFALIWGLIVFGDLPGLWSALGMALILAAGLALVWQAARGGRA